MSDNTESPRMPNFWWSPTSGLWRGGGERPCADAVKLGDVESWRTPPVSSPEGGDTPTPAGEVKRINVAVNPETVEMLAHMIDRDQVSLTEAARVLMGVGDAITRLAKDDGRRILAMDADGDTTEVVVMTNPGDGIREYEPSEFVLDGVTLHEGRCSACVWWAPTKDPALTRAEFDAHVCTEYPARTPSVLPVAPNLGAGDSEVPEIATLPPEVCRLVHAVDRMRDSWNNPDSKWTNDELWRHLHACNAAVWGRNDPAGSVGGDSTTVETPAPYSGQFEVAAPGAGGKWSTLVPTDSTDENGIRRCGACYHPVTDQDEGCIACAASVASEPAGVSSSDGEVATPLADLPHEEWRGFRTAATGTDPGPAPAQPGEDTTP